MCSCFITEIPQCILNVSLHHMYLFLIVVILILLSFYCSPSAMHNWMSCQCDVNVCVFLYMVEWLFPRELRRRGLELAIGPRFLCSAKCLPDNHLFFALWFVFSITWKGKWFGIFYFHVLILNPNWKTKLGEAWEWGYISSSLLHIPMFQIYTGTSGPQYP